MSTCQDENHPIEDCSDCNQMNSGFCPFRSGYVAALKAAVARPADLDKLRQISEDEEEGGMSAADFKYFDDLFETVKNYR